MKNTRTTRALPGLVIAALLVAPLAACGGDADATADAPSPTTPAASAPASTEQPADESPAPTDAAETPAAATGDVTPAGATLAFGEAGTFPWDPTGDGETNITVKVVDVAQGDPAKDLASFDSESQKALEGQNLWYLHVDLTGDPADAYGRVSSMQVGLADQDGDDLRPLIVLGDFEPCPEVDVPDDGSTVTTCLPFYGSPSQTPTQVLWQDSDTPYDQFDGKPVVWTK